METKIHGVNAAYACFYTLLAAVNSIQMAKENTSYLYEMKSASNEYTGDALLTEDEEKIMRAMRRLDNLWKKYKDNGGDNNLILFAGGSGCSIRFQNPSGDNEIESYPFIRCEGGDGGDAF